MYMLKVSHFRSTKGICESCPTLKCFLAGEGKAEANPGHFPQPLHTEALPFFISFFFFFLKQTLKIDQKALVQHEILGLLWYLEYCLFSALVLATRTA